MVSGEGRGEGWGGATAMVRSGVEPHQMPVGRRTTRRRRIDAASTLAVSKSPSNI